MVTLVQATGLTVLELLTITPATFYYVESAQHLHFKYCWKEDLGIGHYTHFIEGANELEKNAADPDGFLEEVLKNAVAPVAKKLLLLEKLRLPQELWLAMIRRRVEPSQSTWSHACRIWSARRVRATHCRVRASHL